MKDKAFVIKTEKNGMAQVKVTPSIPCQKCRAKDLCVGAKQHNGLLRVKNQINAQEGDNVIIEIPDTYYNKNLIFLFTSLLLASLLGMTAGYLLSSFIPFSPQTTSVAGLFVSVVIAGVVLFRILRKKNNSDFFPVIINIQGGSHG